MVLALSGYVGSGKDSVAKILAENHGWQRIAFADKVRELTLAIFPQIKKLIAMHGWDHAKRHYPQVRSALQRVGHHCQGVFGRTVWCDATNLRNELLDDPSANFVITDMRYPHEFDWICGELNNLTRLRFAWVDRPGTGPVEDAAGVGGSESHYGWLGRCADFTISNAGSLDDLQNYIASPEFWSKLRGD